MSESYKTKNILFLYGDDLFYNDINSSIQSIKLIQAFSQSTEGLTIKFATATEYFQAVLAENKTFSVFEGDFHPYVTKDVQFRSMSWTGFYSSRPSLKQKVLETHSLVRAAEIISALIFKKDFQAYNACIGLHHDAITGTCTSEVANDYLQRLNDDIEASENSIRRAYSSIVTSNSRPLRILKPYKAFVIHNPINWKLEKVLTISTDSLHVAVHDNTGTIIPSQSVPYNGIFKVYFKITLQPLSFTTVFLSSHGSDCKICVNPSRKSNKNHVANGIYTVEFRYGLIETITTESSRYHLMEKIVRYDAAAGGAYEFRPLVICI